MRLIIKDDKREYEVIYEDGTHWLCIEKHANLSSLGSTTSTTESCGPIDRVTLYRMNKAEHDIENNPMYSLGWVIFDCSSNSLLTEKIFESTQEALNVAYEVNCKDFYIHEIQIPRK